MKRIAKLLPFGFFLGVCLLLGGATGAAAPITRPASRPAKETKEIKDIPPNKTKKV